jgi:hypothetical protein
MSRRRGGDFFCDWLGAVTWYRLRVMIGSKQNSNFPPKLMQNFCSPPADVARYIADSTEISDDVVTRLFAWSYRTPILTAAYSGNKPLPGRRVLLLRPENLQCRGGKYPKKLLAAVPVSIPGKETCFRVPQFCPGLFFLKCGIVVVLSEYIIKEHVTRQRTDWL